MNTKFKKGDKVIYPSHGLGVIKDITEQVFGEMSIKFLVVSFDKLRMNLRIPLDKVEVSGLRHITDKKSIDQAIEEIQKPPKAKKMMWSKKAVVYEEQVNSGDIDSIAQVIRNLHHKTYSENPSYSERNVYENALEKLVDEYAAIYDIPEDDAMEKLEDLLRNAEEKRSNKKRLSKDELDDLDLDDEFENLSKELKGLDI